MGPQACEIPARTVWATYFILAFIQQLGGLCSGPGPVFLSLENAGLALPLEDPVWEPCRPHVAPLPHASLGLGRCGKWAEPSGPSVSAPPYLCGT